LAIHCSSRIVVAEAGLPHAKQRDAESDGGFVGLGVGASR
jgi:hypothetical protein